MQALYYRVHIAGVSQIKQTGIVAHNFHLINEVMAIHINIAHAFWTNTRL